MSGGPKTKAPQNKVDGNLTPGEVNAAESTNDCLATCFI